MLLTFLFYLCILHFNKAKKANVEVTLHRKDIFPLFTEDEIWRIQFENKTEDIVQLNVVIDDSKLMNLKNDQILSFDIIYDDVLAVIEAEKYRLNNRIRWNSTQRPDIFFLEYRDWIEYVLFIDYILLTYPDITSRSYSGTTIQGRDIPVITLSTGNNDDGTIKNLYIQAAAHAREWLSNAATMYILNALCVGYGNNNRITNILNRINIYIVPTVNIDGYIYSWSDDRMWRKNRRNNGNNIFGVDLNRNYDGPPNTWCTIGASTNPTSNSYCGIAPYSEPETQASAGFISNELYNIGAAVDMHTFGQLLLWPWGSYDTVPPPYYEEFVELGQMIQDAIYNVNGMIYESTQAVNLYPTSGTMRDFSFAQIGAYGYTWEGRGPGFDATPDNIIPAGQEQLDGHLTLAEYLINKSGK
eukprot:498601_1